MGGPTKEPSPEWEWIEPASPGQWEEARRLVEEYAASLGVDLSFQDFHAEVTDLPSKYGPPGGAFLMAVAEGRAAGCGGLCRFSDREGEIKRLYVAPSWRGRGLARRLMERLIGRARGLGYSRLLLDTLPSMKEAQSLYRSLGFRSVPSYRFNPVEGTDFMALDLAARD
jgi:GNAT superfamily N-acetyltransferase